MPYASKITALGEGVVVADIAVHSCQRSGRIVLVLLDAEKEAKHHLIFYFHAPNLTRIYHFRA
ncbi:hypothetical protein BN2475_120160 [Paraburkholderia ribeironis]|uniref:Uncharacterized protein n=1 Tax=Paraburkholderia ribeironis TaxID=1247936 RepID=A0A1N7RRJ0_9BURK|nr:hypothetical protein BN2475_120160 [Paraburkholderia ribeironis]